MTKLEFSEFLVDMGVPTNLITDRYWRSALYLMTSRALRDVVLPHYYDFKKEIIEIHKLKKVRGLSHSQDFLLSLALHLFNDTNKLPKDGLTGLSYLDSENFKLAIEAIIIRYNG